MDVYYYSALDSIVCFADMLRFFFNFSRFVVKPEKFLDIEEEYAQAKLFVVAVLSIHIYKYFFFHFKHCTMRLFFSRHFFKLNRGALF